MFGKYMDKKPKNKVTYPGQAGTRGRYFLRGFAFFLGTISSRGFAGDDSMRRASSSMVSGGCSGVIGSFFNCDRLAVMGWSLCRG